MTKNDNYHEMKLDGGSDSLSISGWVESKDSPAEIRDLIRGRDHRDVVDVEFQDVLGEAIRRRPLLGTLKSGSATATELAKSVPMSRSTIHRAINKLEDYNLIQKSDGKYALTSTGEIIADKTEAFGTEVNTVLILEPFLNAVDLNVIPTELFADARITCPKPRQPHTSILRIIELIERSDEIRMLSTVLSPLYVNVGYREMMNGTRIEAIFDEEVIEIMVSEYANEAYETVKTGNFKVYSHAGLPFELFIREESIGMAAHDENGFAQILIECDSPGAVEWAEDLFYRYHAEAEPLSMSTF